VIRALLIGLFAATLAAKELTITGGGRRVIDLDPAHSDDNCRGWSYDPMPLRDDAGDVTIVYGAGDALTNHCTAAPESPERFGDRIWRWARQPDGTWSGAPVVTRENLGWMSDDAYVVAHPEAFVAHFASPAVVRADGRYYMAFAASVNDPHLCAGEHDASNACGACKDPWSYFTLMWAVSDDGVTWTVRDRDPLDPNRALGASTLWREPSSIDRGPTSIYKGITHVSMVRDGGWFYLLTQFWMKGLVKMALFRIAADPSSPFGITGDPELWHTNFATGHTWDACPGGRVPDWIDDSGVSLMAFSHPMTSIAATTAFPGYRYIAFASGAGTSRIEYQLSNDLISWSPSSQVVRSAIPFFADGRAYANSVIAPAAVEDGAGRMHFFFASGDGDDDHGIDRDGVRDCSVGGGSPTTIFVGSGIYEATADLIDLAPTTTTIEPKSNPTNIGPATFIVRVTSPAGAPSGRVSVSGGGFAETAVIDGYAEVTYSIRLKGSWIINAFFTSPAMPWADSHATVVQQVTNPPPKRRASGR
jgi:hypothetical protein